jgi:hypothetical protein
MNFDYLETVGKFIGTYGLAVFLVLYYAVRLYPEIQKERAEWIRQLTRLRQLVDPASRPLTRDQARTVMQLASDALADRLRLVLDVSFRDSGLVRSSSGSGAVTANLFGQEISFDPATNIDQEMRDQEFEKILSDIDRALKDQTRRSRENLDEAFKFVSEMARRDAYRLALLRFGNTSLESVWTKAYDDSTKQWSDGLTKTLQPFERYDIDEIRRFVGRHPSSATKKDAVELLFTEIRFISGQEHATYLKTIFDRNVEAELRKIDASDEEL